MGGAHRVTCQPPVPCEVSSRLTSVWGVLLSTLVICVSSHECIYDPSSIEHDFLGELLKFLYNRMHILLSYHKYLMTLIIIYNVLGRYQYPS